MLELLVPGGSPEGVTAAVQNGADAVYMGFEGLTDCQAAMNFADGDFESTVRYCRTRGCKVYLAMNIQLKDSELSRAAGLALRAQRAGVDAILLRDLGLFRILRKLLPDMPLYGDPNLGFYTPADAEVAAQLGFQRIYLPPELPLEEIRRIKEANESMEIGVIVQGSLCPSAVGQCHMSTVTGNESRSRGICTGLCREHFSLGGRWDTTPLSMKDRCMLADVEALEEMGIVSACIAGREYRPEYAAAFTELYRKAIAEKQQPAPSDLERLEKAFSYWGFAKKDIFEPAGEPRKPDKSDERFYNELRKSYLDSELRRVGVTFAMVARSDSAPIRMGVEDNDGHRCLMDGPIPSPMGDLPLKEEALTEAMYRTAGTPYRCDSVKVASEGEFAIASSELDMARRALLYKLSEERGRPPEKTEGTFPEAPETRRYPTLPVFNFAFQTLEQMTPEMAALRPCCVYAPAELLAAHPERLEPFLQNGATPVAMLPSLVCGREEVDQLQYLLATLREQGIEQVLTDSLGMALYARQEDMKLRGDIHLGVWNGYSAQNLASAGFLSATASFELTLEEIRRLPKPLDLEMVIYGRLPVMTTHTCLLHESAGRCTCTIPGQMADDFGGVWPVTKAFACRNTVWAAQKLWMADKVAEWVHAGLWSVRMNFSTESPRECLEVANSYIHGTGYRPNGMTRGLYYRGVE